MTQESILYDDDKTPFNMAFEFLKLINSMQKETITARIEADYLKWLRILEGLYDLCHFKFKTDEEDLNKLNKLITESEMILKNGYSNADIFKLTVGSLNDKLRELTRLINDLLYKHEFLYPHDKERKSYLDIIKEDFK
jgi:hypothetical protein